MICYLSDFCWLIAWFGSSPLTSVATAVNPSTLRRSIDFLPSIFVPVAEKNTDGPQLTIRAHFGRFRCHEANL
jgi:hypothetical protein